MVLLVKVVGWDLGGAPAIQVKGDEGLDSFRLVETKEEVECTEKLDEYVKSLSSQPTSELRSTKAFGAHSLGNPPLKVIGH